MIVADTGNDRLQIFHVEELVIPRDDPAEQGRSGDGRGGGSGDEDNDVSRECLLVFDGREHAEKLRKRCTAGESETAEGPLAQPCDVAYWRQSPPQGGGRGQGRERRQGAIAENDSSVGDWCLRLPEWFQPYDSGRRLSSPPADNKEDEDRARREQLLSASPNRSNGAPGAGGKKPIDYHQSFSDSTGTAQGIIAADVGAVVGDGTPRPGAFVVRETGLTSGLQLLFVAKTQVLRRSRKGGSERGEKRGRNHERGVSVCA